MVGITILQGKARKAVLHHFFPAILPVDMGILEQVSQDELQGGEGQWTGRKFIQARRRFIPLPNIRSLMSLSPKAKAKV